MKFSILMPYVIVALVGAPVLASPKLPGHAGANGVQQKQVRIIVHILMNCPNWTNIAPSFMHPDAPQKIMRSMVLISKYDTATIALAERQYIMEEGDKDYSADYRSGKDPRAKIFLLNRFLFDVPQVLQVNLRPDLTYSYVGPGRTTLMPTRWPMEREKDGSMGITEWSHIMFTSGWAPNLGSYWTEFEYFRSHFKRRTKF